VRYAAYREREGDGPPAKSRERAEYQRPRDDASFRSLFHTPRDGYKGPIALCQRLLRRDPVGHDGSAPFL
jgi:hypothetical protein